MKTKLSTILFFVCCFVATSSFAQNRWGVIGGANLSTTSAEGFKWKVGGYVGGLYDIQLSKSWYIQPQLIFTYEENDPKDQTHISAFSSQYALTIPVLASFKIG